VAAALLEGAAGAGAEAAGLAALVAEVVDEAVGAVPSSSVDNDT
jgi:hypothetical protein